MSDLRIVATVAGERLLLTGSGITLLDYSGLGMANVRRLSEVGPFQLGETDLDYRQDSRIVMLKLGLTGRGRDPLLDLENLRQRLMTVFRPRVNDPVTLTLTTNGRLLQLDGNLEGLMDVPMREWVGYADQMMTLTVKAGDPRLYDPRLRTISFNIVTALAGWNIPWPIPWSIGESILDVTQTIYYANGDKSAAEEYPIIRIAGPIYAPVVENLTTGEQLAFTAEGGLLLEPGDYVDINLGYGYKTAVNQLGASVEQYLSDGNDLATWHLAYNTELLNNGTRCDGTNAIRVTGIGATLNTEVVLTYYDRYLGL